MNSVVALLLFLGVVSGDKCEPGFADECFIAVQSDLQYMLNLKNFVAVNVTQAAVNELCLALEDSLNCTSDIIDEDCSESEGKYRFDSWLEALREANRYVCEGNRNNLKSILEGISCWSIEDFMLCTREFAKIEHVKNLLDTPIDEAECKKLLSVTSQCYDKSVVRSCREREDIPQLVGNMINAFFAASDCVISHGSREAMHSNSNTTHINISLTLVVIISSVLFWKRR